MPAKREIPLRWTTSIALTTVLIALGSTRPSLVAQSAEHRVIAVTLDGMRWQEIFGGADRSLIVGEAGGVADTGATLGRFWRESPEARRRALLPFLWETIASRGQILGDSTRGSAVRVTNGKWFSYPGYNELFTGAPDDRIDSNDKIPNPNRTVLEWLVRRPGFEGAVEVFGSWDVFPYIFNVVRSGLPVNGDGPPFPAPATPEQHTASEMAEWLPVHWAGVRLDAATMQPALDALRSRRPRVLVVLLGETDEWAHERRYDLYLDAAHRADRFIARLWTVAQSLPEYAGRTSLLISTDHGRGQGRDWTDHGIKLPTAGRIWMAMMGPRTPPWGVRSGAETTQSQFAATLAELVGEDWQSARPDAAPVVGGGVVKGRDQ